MSPFVPYYWNNRDEFVCLCQDLDLIPCFMVTQSMIDYWRDTINNEFIKELSQRELDVARTYRQELMKEIRNSRRFNKKVFNEDLQLIPFNQD